MDITQTFFKAIKTGDLTNVKALLITNPALVNASTRTGESAVLLAVYYNEPEIVKLLLALGAQLTIFEAAAVGKLERVRELLASGSTQVNAFATDGFTSLGLAAFFGHLNVVELLLEKGADVNLASRNAQHVMPLHSAVAHQHLAIAKALLAHGADVNAIQADNFTPLHEAAQNGQADMLHLLLTHGAHVNVRKADGETPLTIAQKQGHQEVVAILQQHGGTV